MGLVGEFKEFIVKGNAMDLAVGVIIGAAFGAVVSSMVQDVLMPPLGFAMGGVDFADKSILLANAIDAGGTHPITGATVAKAIPAVEIKYGKLINAIIALLIQGFCIFLVVKGINSLRRKPDPAPSTAPAPTPQEKLLEEIRDLLKTR